jgi:hypothetical protein
MQELGTLIRVQRYQTCMKIERPTYPGLTGREVAFLPSDMDAEKLAQQD